MGAFLFHDQFHIRMLIVGALDFNRGEWNTQNVRDNLWRFYMNDRDSAYINLDQSTFSFAAEQLYIVPAGVHFGCRNEVPFKHFYIHFDVLGLSRSMKDELFSQPIELMREPALEKETVALADVVRRAGENTPPLAVQYRLQALVVSAFAHHLQTISPSVTETLDRLSQQQAPIAPALEYIEKNLASSLTNELLASLCYLSEDYFARRFREIMGETPGHYIRARRVAIASQELLFSSDSIEEIAVRVGFCNRFYFSRVFASEMGMPPASYRKQTRP